MADKEAKDNEGQSEAQDQRKLADGDMPKTPPEAWKPRVPNEVVYIKGV